MTDPGLAQALAVLDTADVRAADHDGCTDLLGAIRQVRGWLDATEVAVTSRMTELHDTSGDMPAADRHTRCGGVSAAEGKRKERRSKLVDEVPSFGTALAAGDITAEHVDALANASAKLDAEVRVRLLALEGELLADATSMSPERFGRACRHRARRLERDAGRDRNERQRNETFLSRRMNPATGMVEGRYAFHPELADQIFGAVDREVAAMVAEGERRGDPDCADRTVDRNRLAAEALGRLVAKGHGEVRPLVADITYVVDEHTHATGELHDHSVCETGSGLPVPPSSIARAMCNGRITPVIVDTNGVVLNAGRTIRHPNRAQRRALRAMYRTCALGGCDVPFDRCEIHHILPWELGGVTDLDNLVPCCSRHHHLIHSLAWRLDLSADRTLTVTDREGRVLFVTEPDVPPSRSGEHRHRRRRAAA